MCTYITLVNICREINIAYYTLLVFIGFSQNQAKKPLLCFPNVPNSVSTK